MDKRKDYDAKDAWLVVDGKKVMNLNINDEQFYGLGDVDWHLPKDNSNQNRQRLLEDFKYKHCQPIPSKRKVILYNFEYVQIPDKDFSRHGKWIE